MGVDDTFEIRTPSSSASVRGTTFYVEVLGPDSTYVAVDEGIVGVQMESQQVDVRAGEEVTATLGQLPEVRQQRNDVSPPPLALLSPAKLPPLGSVVVVSGRTEPGATVTVADQVVAVDSSGYFEIQVAVNTNWIIIKVEDQAGNMTTLRLSGD
jgi:hypothetical protein